jgi:hypothetical protein
MANKYIIKIPPKATPLEAENWRAVDAIQNAMFTTTNKVDSPTTGLKVIIGKVKIDAGDSTAGYLQDKLKAGTGIALTESLTGGKGAKILTASVNTTHTGLTDMPDTGGTNTDHDVRYVTKIDTATPSTPAPFNGMLWYDTDEPEDYSIYEMIVCADGDVVTHDEEVVYYA